MSYEVLARKWRPQQFDDVVGQTHVTQTLKNAITAKRIAHAYLFVGPRGTGKTSVARIFAKALNCMKGPTVTPCDQCPSCLEVMSGTSLDVMEIDGASNNGVEQVRELRETVKYAPARSSYKIYIIDEVHMLSTQAFNALLKTLEEPPSHVKFLFATTEAEKILATIVSRCQRFDLRRIPVPLLMERLAQVAKAEKVTVDEDALLAIARGAEGGLRDAESALDQLISFKGTTIVEEDVLSVFGLVSRGLLEDLAEKLLGGDIPSVIRTVAQLDAAGKDLQRVVVELMEQFRNLLVCMHVGDKTEGLDLTEAQIQRLRQMAKLTTTERVLRITGILSETEDRMKYALSRRTLLETALIRCARAAVVVTLEEILTQINALKKAGGMEDGGSPEGGARRSGPDAGSGGSPGGSGEDGDGPGNRASESGRDSVGRTGPVAGAGHDGLPARAGRVSEKTAEGASDPRKASTPFVADEVGFLKEKWREVIDQVGKIDIRVRSALVDAVPLSVEGDKVVVGLDREFAGELERFQAPKDRRAVEHVLGTFLKRPLTAEFVVSERVMADRAEAASHVSSPEPEKVEERQSPAKGAAAVSPTKRKTVRDWATEPAVQKVLEMFDGTLMDVRE